MPAKRIIILDQETGQSFRYVFWADVPTTRQAFYADPVAVSRWKDATTADNAALQSGAVAELSGTVSVPMGEPLNTSIARLQVLWGQFQNRVTNQNAWARYGSFWDGTTWTVAGVT